MGFAHPVLRVRKAAHVLATPVGRGKDRSHAKRPWGGIFRRQGWSRQAEWRIAWFWLVSLRTGQKPPDRL